ncbi:hypothetical protein PUN28_008752 [Cardiocondyla obscurior]|uniref:Ribosomal protein L20 n=1 Tax=Cardiocondyla obscurior TaxID=286306 RepID=A0AAW2G0T4_9HYME
MRKTIFGIQAVSCTRRETLERRNYTRASVWAYVDAGTRTRPAFDCILRIYSGRRVYARRARFAYPFFFFPPFFFLSLYSFSPYSLFLFHARGTTRIARFNDHRSVAAKAFGNQSYLDKLRFSVRRKRKSLNRCHLLNIFNGLFNFINV